MLAVLTGVVAVSGAELSIKIWIVALFTAYVVFFSAWAAYLLIYDRDALRSDRHSILRSGNRQLKGRGQSPRNSRFATEGRRKSAGKKVNEKSRNRIVTSA